MSVNPIMVVTLFVIFQLMLFTIFLLASKQRAYTSNKILAVILISQVLWYLESSLFHWGKSIIHYFLHFMYLGESLSYMWGPGLFLYIRYLTHRENKFKVKDSLFFLPVLLHLAFMAYKYHFKPAYIKQEIINNSNVLDHLELAISWSLFCINNISFTVAAYINLIRYKKLVKNEKATEINVNSRLITIVLIGFISTCIIEFGRYLAFLTGRFALINPLYVTTLIDTYIFISILIFGILKKPELFNLKKEAVKYNSSPLTTSDINSYSEKLKEYMNKEKPYLNDLLSLEDLAKSLDIAPRLLSQVINQAFNQNFFDFINSYRIAYAIEMLSNNKGNKTVSEIYFSSGFNSKATFYKAFKKQMNTTPTEYRKIQMSVSKI